MKRQFFVTKLRTSVFFKLLCVLLATGLIINLLVLMSFHLMRPRPEMPPQLSKNIDQYLHYLAAEMARDSSFKKAAELSKKLELGVRIEGFGWSWVSDPQFQQDDPMRDKKAPKEPFGFSLLKRLPGFGHPREISQGRRHRGGPPEMPLVEQKFERGPAKVTFFPRLPGGPPIVSFRVNWDAVSMLIAILSLVVLSSYLLIRWILRPLRSLATGVERISQGDFQSRIQHESNDELGRLIIAFNAMGDKLAEMMESKRRLLIDVSHELRSPLQRARVALEFVPDKAVRQEVMEEIDDMGNLVHKILEGAEIESGGSVLNLERTNLWVLVAEIVDKYAKAGECVTLIGSDSNIVSLLDQDRIRSVVRNLIENAIKYSPRNSHVEVQVREAGEEDIALDVSDHGAGIPQAELKKIFEPFYRVDKSRSRATGGFGLGLNLCKKILEAHGGRIMVESVEGQGTKFTVVLKRI